MNQRPKLCANGTKGYRSSSGAPYALNNPCTQSPEPGHVHCRSCRGAAGGYILPIVHTDRKGP